MSEHRRIRRRDFLRGTVGVVAAAALPLPAFSEEKSPSEKLSVAVIGVAGRGSAQLGATGSRERVTALCDIDSRNLRAASERFPRASTYADFRQMLEEMEDKIDAVTVSTPDHTHAPATAMALRLSKHVYCEKPLTHDVHEARTVARLAKEKGVATQMGTQIHAGDNYRRVVEWIRAGVIGPVTEVHVWCGKDWGGGTRPTETPPVPKHLDWDLWLGPAPYRPYHPSYLPGNWRRWWDFGNGTLGDMACHLMDLPFWALDLRHPTTIEAEGSPVDTEGCPHYLTVNYEFPARGSRPALKLSWYDGKCRPNPPADWKMPVGGMGVLFVGKEGGLLADYGKRELYPREKFQHFEAPPQAIAPSIGHHEEWFAACKTGSPTTCNFGYSGALTETVLLGTVAYRVGKKITWDAAGFEAKGCPEADRFLRREYRKGWKL